MLIFLRRPIGTYIYNERRLHLPARLLDNDTKYKRLTPGL